MSKTGFYAGSFDPLTNGHVEVIRAALRCLDCLVVGVGIHPIKVSLFTAQERVDLVHAVCVDLLSEMEADSSRLRVIFFDDLTIAAAERSGASVLVRGLRDGSDFNYEMQLAGMNASLAPGIQTVFLPATLQTRHITATLVRQIAQMKGDITPFVPRRIAVYYADKIGAGQSPR